MGLQRVHVHRISKTKSWVYVGLQTTDGLYYQHCYEYDPIMPFALSEQNKIVKQNETTQ